MNICFLRQIWRGGREAEGDGLLNRYTGNRIGGSNPPLSATRNEWSFFQKYRTEKVERSQVFCPSAGGSKIRILSFCVFMGFLEPLKVS